MSALSRQITIPGICDSYCLKKLEFLLSQKFAISKDLNLPLRMVFKTELRRVGLQREVHVEVFTNSNVAIKASPEIRSSFDAISNEIEQILTEAVNVTSRQDTVRVNRARRIKDYITHISVDDEVERMVIVVMCDVILDLIVTEKLSRFTRRREELESDSVGAKISMLENTCHVPLYNARAIRDVRDLRNKVAHGGATLARDEADFSRSATLDIFDLL